MNADMIRFEQAFARRNLSSLEEALSLDVGIVLLPSNYANIEYIHSIFENETPRIESYNYEIPENFSFKLLRNRKREATFCYDSKKKDLSFQESSEVKWLDSHLDQYKPMVFQFGILNGDTSNIPDVCLGQAVAENISFYNYLKSLPTHLNEKQKDEIKKRLEPKILQKTDEGIVFSIYNYSLVEIGFYSLETKQTNTLRESDNTYSLPSSGSNGMKQSHPLRFYLNIMPGTPIEEIHERIPNLAKKFSKEDMKYIPRLSFE